MAELGVRNHRFNRNRVKAHTLPVGYVVQANPRHNKARKQGASIAPAPLPLPETAASVPPAAETPPTLTPKSKNDGPRPVPSKPK